MMDSAPNVAKYLAGKKNTKNKELAAEWTTVESLYNTRQWNELTIKMIDLVQNPAVRNNDSLLSLYQNFISYFEMNISPFGLTQIVEFIVDQIADKNEAIKFLKNIKNKVEYHNEAVWYIEILQGNIYLQDLNDIESTRKIVEKLRKVFEKTGTITPVYQKFFKLACQYYRHVGQHNELLLLSSSFL